MDGINYILKDELRYHIKNQDKNSIETEVYINDYINQPFQGVYPLSELIFLKANGQVAVDGKYKLQDQVLYK